jgi:hypothetical protein
MLLSLIFVILGLLILYLVIDFLVFSGADIHTFAKKWILRTLWLWLPVVALPRLFKEVVLKKK